MTQQQKDDLFNLLMKFRKYEQTAGQPNEEYQKAYEAIEKFITDIQDTTWNAAKEKVETQGEYDVLNNVTHKHIIDKYPLITDYFKSRLEQTENLMQKSGREGEIKS